MHESDCPNELSLAQTYCRRNVDQSRVGVGKDQEIYISSLGTQENEKWKHTPSDY
jgi:hypothetical protein